MADPRKNIPTVYKFQPNCPTYFPDPTTAPGTEKKGGGFLDGIAKIGGIEGLGSVGEGFRELGEISNAIRSGATGIPAVDGVLSGAFEAIDGGVGFVTETTGIAGVLDSVGPFHPDVFNRTVGQARSVYDSVKNGNLELNDIGEIMADFKNVVTLGKNIFGDKEPEKVKEVKVCAASPYAMDLIQYAPKFNFMFFLDVQFSEEYVALNEAANRMAFVIQTSTRPNIEFEHEDINMYNFWTKVPKRTVYQPMTVTFLDDIKNSAHIFYSTYLRSMSPIANMKNRAPQAGTYEYSSMDYGKRTAKPLADGDVYTNYNSSSLGVLEGGANSIIQRIRLFHIFGHGAQMNIYNFYNPRILTMNPSDLTMMESGEGGRFEIQFAYDGLYIDDGYEIREDDDGRYLVKTLTGEHVGAKFAINTPELETGEASTEAPQAVIAPEAQQDEVQPVVSEETAASAAPTNAPNNPDPTPTVPPAPVEAPPAAPTVPAAVTPTAAVNTPRPSVDDLLSGDGGISDADFGRTGGTEITGADADALRDKLRRSIRGF